MLRLPFAFAIASALVPGAACGGGGDDMACDFDIEIGLSVQPTYEFTGGPATRVNVVRAEDPLTIVWGVATPNADDVASPVVHGEVPEGATQTSGEEPTLSGGVDYTVIISRTDGAQCEEHFTP